MQNHNCVFANYCHNYRDNKCQGCSRLNSNITDIKNSVVEQFKKKFAERTDYTAFAGRYKTNTKYMGVPDMRIKKVHFNEPMTVVIWEDGTKTMIKCQPGDTYSKEAGLAIAIAKKALGNKGNFNEVFKKWIPEYGKDDNNV